MSGYLYIAATVMLTVFGQLVLKWQVTQVGHLPPTALGKAEFLFHLLLRPWVLAGLGAAFAASLFWMMALKKLPLSTAYPFTASSFILILLFSVVFLREPLSLGKIAGTALVILGVFIMAKDVA